MNKTLCPGNIEVKPDEGKHQAGAMGRERVGASLLQRGLLPQFGVDHQKHTQTRNKENLIPIKPLPSQKRKYAQNNAVF
ncbi:hypothetical protein [Paraburkholderia caffeinilytica]|uniref:hypothetical protein n=1 Tax=Paraburkholderia caffeinilytica TaxID=1761016 RepID=UPI0038BA646E